MQNTLCRNELIFRHARDDHEGRQLIIRFNSLRLDDNKDGEHLVKNSTIHVRIYPATDCKRILCS